MLRRYLPAALLLTVVCQWLDAASPTIGTIQPRGFQRGTEATLILGGARLADAKELLFYAPGFTRRMLAYAQRSGAIRDVLAELVLGEQGYLGLKRRLLKAGPRFLLESAVALARGRAS